jgi:hypothetical protein
MEILPFSDLGYPEFDEMLSRYTIIEFNTAVKPYFIDYFWKADGVKPTVVYLDPDILLYQRLDHVFEALKKHAVVLTPMFCEAPAQTSLDELVALRHGMFNLGFIAVKYAAESQRLIDWWKERLRTHCLIDKARGIFVDQKWIDLTPLLFEGIFVLKHKGYNMAWWNFSERKLLDLEEGLAVNQSNQLLYFFHFSGFKPDSDYITGRSGEPQFSYTSRPELKRLGLDYGQLLKENRYDFFNRLKPKLTFYSPKPTTNSKVKNIVKRLIRRFV